jgi:hypothetical protein
MKEVKPFKYPKKLVEFVKNKSLQTGICVYYDYRYGKHTIAEIIHFYKNHP